MITEKKAKKFAGIYLKNGFNGSKAIQEIEPGNKLTPGSRGVKAHRTLNNDKVKKALAEILEEEGFSDEEVRGILKRNARQSKSIAASNQAIDIALKVRGSYAPEKKLNLNVNLADPVARRRRAEELIAELDSLKTLGGTTQDAEGIKLPQTKGNAV